MNDYNNKFHDYFFERNDEENSLNNFIENKSPLFNENDDEEDDLIYKTKDFYINNNLSKFVTCENSPNNLCENESVEINNNLSASQKTNETNNYVLTQAELFVIPSDKFNNFNQEKKILGRKKKILLFKAKKINFQKII